MKTCNKLIICLGALTSFTLSSLPAQAQDQAQTQTQVQQAPQADAANMKPRHVWHMKGKHQSHQSHQKKNRSSEHGKRMQAAQGSDSATMLEAQMQRLDRLKTKLNISTAQEAAWQSFVDTNRQQMTDMLQARSTALEQFKQAKQAGQDQPRLNAPERMEKHIEFMKQRLVHMENRQAALKALYVALTPEQQRIADRHLTQSKRGQWQKTSKNTRKMQKKQRMQPATPASAASSPAS